MTSGDQLARLVRQHARTAQLMGVDFVPAYRAAGTVVQTPAVEPSIGEPVVEPVRTARAGGAARAIAIPPPGARDPVQVQAQLDELRARYEHDAPHARFDTQFNRIVFGEGDPCARLLFCGEAPGEDEDRTGRPFVGRAGQLLEKMITAMGLSRGEVYICNVLKTRPPNNRTPTPEESAACAPYLHEQISIVRPEVIVSLGRPATHLLLGTTDAMGRLRGRWSEYVVPPPPIAAPYSGPYEGMRFPVMPTYHPSYLLRSYTEENRKMVWSDLRQVMEKLGLRLK